MKSFTSISSQRRRPSKKIQHSHIVWFEESNSWIQFELPAWFIYCKILNGSKPKEISTAFSKKYSLGFKESLTIVTEIHNEIKKLKNYSFHKKPSFPCTIYSSPPKFFSKRVYLINQKRIEILFGSSLLEYLIHSNFSHLEAKSKLKHHYCIEVFQFQESFVLKTSDKAWAENDSNTIKRKLFIELTNLIYNKTENDWLAYIHGSAISNEHETIVLSTACGSGKSTLAALLCKNGLKFVSDDYVPIDAWFCKAYPFPAALSVKDGAYPILLPLYEELKDSQVYHFKGTNKTVKYLAFPDDGNYYKPLPVKNFVFVVYDKTMPYSFRKVPTLEAIKRFNDEAWLSPTPAHARKFLKWFPGVNCYELVYSDNDRAINQVKSLFEIPPK